MTHPILIDYYNKGICRKSRPANRRSFVMCGRNLLYMLGEYRSSLAENKLKKGIRLVIIFIIVILFVYLFDFVKLRKQNETMIAQNEKIIALLEEIKNK